MKAQGLIANAQVLVNATIDKVRSDWKEGSEIIWKGEWYGKAYQDKGEIAQIKPKTYLQYTNYLHF